MKSTVVRFEKARGFTMLDLLMVVVVIGILVGIAFPRYLEARDRGHVGAAQADLTALRQALAFFAADYDRYPEALASLDEMRETVTDPMGLDYMVLPEGTTFQWVSYELSESGDYLLKIQALDNDGTVLCATGDRIWIQS